MDTAKKLTFIDSGVLIIATRTNDPLIGTAVKFLDAAEREFASSQFVVLEVMPKATYHKKKDEVDFYNAFFAGVRYWADNLPEIVEQAKFLANTYGLSALDALHVAAALSVQADDFITSERGVTPLFRVKELNIISLHP